ncbi:MAG: AI-2E family transporter [Mariniphaga sp.]|nr:AI-2E family transporter [Mariniphaga sp.]
MDQELKLPFYAKTSIFLIGLMALVAILYIAQSIIIPLVFAIIFAIVLHPVVNFFVRLRINRIISIVLALLLATIALAALVALLFTQASRFTESWPILVDKFTDILNQTISSAAVYLDIDPTKIHEWITKSVSELLNFSTASIGQTIVTVGNGVMIMFLLPLYIFLILYYQPLILEFIRRLFCKDDQSQVKEIVTETKTTIQRYLSGLIIEAFIVAGMDIAVLFTLGVDYAILLGVIGAILNVIPYIGGLVAVALPMLVALATNSSVWSPVYVLIGYYIIQLIDNNYIVPYIVASKVKINALFSIIVVFVGNAIWGIPGMFLSIPLLAIVKLIFDRIDSLKPWGLLLGDTMPPFIKIKPFRLRRLKPKPE